MPGRHHRRSCRPARGGVGAPIARMFDLHADPKAIAAHFASDPWLSPLIEAAPGLRVPGAWSAFELVVRAIVGQQVSVKAATTIIGRLVQRAGLRIEDHPHERTAWRFRRRRPRRGGHGADRHAGQARGGVARLCAAVASGEVPLDSHAVDTATYAPRCWPYPVSGRGPSNTWRCAPGATPTPGPPGIWSDAIHRGTRSGSGAAHPATASYRRMAALARIRGHASVE